MSIIIDRRLNGRHKSSPNREKFMRRVKGKIKETVDHVIRNKKLKDINKDDTEIRVKRKDLSEPTFENDHESGERRGVNPGNKEFHSGDQVDKPQGGQGQGRGRQGSPDGEGEDDFIFEINREEFLDVLFEDLALPHMIRTSLKDVKQWEKRRAGYSTDGVPTNLNVVKSLENSIGRRIAMKAPIKAEIADLTEKLDVTKDPADRDHLKELIAELEKRLESVPFIDDYDLRYNAYTKDPVPATNAVMFCLMDISGSMGQYEKDLAKRFFYLLYLFLGKKYEKVDVVFISHHTRAREVDEEEFFFSHESGGTVVSSALELMSEVIQERYSGHEWNIYGAQASDGDNWYDDSAHTVNLLTNKILPAVQYFSYIETAHEPNGWFDNSTESELWNAYQALSSKENFVMRRVEEPSDIYPVFRELFSREGVEQ